MFVMTIPEAFAQVTHVFAGTAVPRGAAVVYGVGGDLPPTPAAVALACHTAWGTNMNTSQTTQITLVETQVKFGPDETGPIGSYSAVSHNGTSGGSAAPPNVAFLATKNTVIGGRRGRGRMYVPGVNEAGIDPNGQLVAANFSQFQTDCTEFLEDLHDAGCDMYVLHGPATEWVLVDGQPRRVPVAGSIPLPSLVTTLVASTTCATQRRRLRG